MDLDDEKYSIIWSWMPLYYRLADRYTNFTRKDKWRGTPINKHVDT